MKKVILFVLLVLILAILPFIMEAPESPAKNLKIVDNEYWFILHRKSNKELLYIGTPGDIQESKLVKTFKVKTGIPNERPTPLPKIMGKEYWLITTKESSAENPETAPYFLTLNIPAPDVIPFGPEPYLECGRMPTSPDQGEQCQWELPGAFGLHGVNGDLSRLSNDNPGSSGCIRHRDEDITYLYDLLDPEKEDIRYYIKDI